MNQFHPPDWLEAWRVSDNLRKDAYEDADDAKRAMLKTALALAAFKFPPTAAVSSRHYCNERLGIWSVDSTQPAQWTAIVLDSSYAAAARICAAAAMPTLAEVKCVFATSVNGAPTKNALVALEMAGIEDIFQINQNQLERFFLEARGRSGRVMLLHNGQLKDTAVACRRLRIPFYEEATLPELFLASPESFNPANLVFAQGFLPPSDAIPQKRLDAVYSDNMEASANNDANLILTPGCEGFWLFPGLNKSFFCDFSQKFGLTNGDAFALS